MADNDKDKGDWSINNLNDSNLTPEQETLLATESIDDLYTNFRGAIQKHLGSLIDSQEDEELAKSLIFESLRDLKQSLSKGSMPTVYFNPYFQKLPHQWIQQNPGVVSNLNSLLRDIGAIEQLTDSVFRPITAIADLNFLDEEPPFSSVNDYEV